MRRLFFSWNLLWLLGVPVTVHAFSDPTQPPEAAASAPRAAHSAPAAPVLQSTLVSPRRRLAVINGKQVRVGDKFDGAVITEISPSQVRMTKGGRETTLRLHPKFTKEIEAVQ